MDLRLTHPHEDLGRLIAKPRSFFDALRDPDQVDGWVLGKALGGMLLLSLLPRLAGLPQELGLTHALLNQMNMALRSLAEAAPPWWGLAQSPLWDGLRSVEGALAYGLTLVPLFFLPLSWILGLLLESACVALLLPFLGASRLRISFVQIFVVGAYVQWLQVLGLFVPAGLLGLLLLGVHAWALSRVFDRTWLQGLLSLSVLPLLYSSVALFVGSTLVFALLWAV